MSYQPAEPISDDERQETRFVVALVASAGGLAALSRVLASLPATFPAPIVVVQHLSPDRPSPLAQILRRRTPLAVEQAAEGMRLAPGLVLIAPPDRHMLVGPEGVISLSAAPPEKFVRPSADVLLRSLAGSFGRYAIAVVLTGMGVDGALGAQAIKLAGGRVIVQDRASSAHFGMPGAVIEAGSADDVLPLSEIAGTLEKLVNGGGAGADG